MEIDSRKNFRFSECAPGNGTLVSGDNRSEGTEAPILGNVPQKCIMGSSMQWRRHILNINSVAYCCNSFNRNAGPRTGIPVREEHTSALTVVDRDHISMILKECHDCPYMGHMSKDRTKERVESTS
ncbi:hypothetical protein O181_128415 [Austropuccinia psidii MF-1]|uniref:Uncharacterized protein n=1 Tax=Austropuccinia psidii MF-1 TaxID=1389203 RepID=A0A9Q3L046_9BASI|nr:hypothetical protein [Austropuccinia psidii MF-1]